MKKKIYLLLLGIIVLASILRFWQLGKVPISPDWDEPALGYSAYSILKTGKDEYGKFLPVVLRSFDDYKPALYSYLIIPSIMLFDLNVFAVRFPSAFFGVLTVLLVFFLIREMFEDYKYKDHLSILSSFLLAISPWHIQFSRVAFETNVGLAFNILTAFFFLKGLKKPYFLLFSSLSAALAIYTYQSEKVFTPLLLVLLIAVYYKRFFSISKKYIAGFIIVGFLAILPMIVSIASDRNSLLRAKGTSIFAAQTELLSDNIVKLEKDQKEKDKIGQILDNRRGVYLTSIAQGYLSHFDLNWLFIKGDLVRHHAPKMGLLYLWELPFFLFGIYSLIFANLNKKYKFLIIGWFLIAPVPASITTGVPHAVRTLNFLPTPQLFTAFGLISAIKFLPKIKYSILNIKLWKIAIISYLLFVFFNFFYYLDQYFVQQNYFNAPQWQYGWEKAVEDVTNLEKNYKKVIVSDKEPLDRAYMFFAFYLKYPPEEYQKVNILQSGGFKEKHQFGKFEFRPINWAIDSKEKDTLFVGSKSEIPLSYELRVKNEIKNPDGTTVMVVVGK